MTDEDKQVESASPDPALLEFARKWPALVEFEIPDEDAPVDPRDELPEDGGIESPGRG